MKLPIPTLALFSTLTLVAALGAQTPAPVPAPGTSTQPTLPKSGTGARRGLEVPDAGRPKNAKPEAPKSGNPQDKEKSAKGGQSQKPNNTINPEDPNAKVEGLPANSIDAVNDPFALERIYSADERSVAVFRALLKIKDVRDLLVERAVDELLRDGELAMQSIQNALRGSHVVSLVVASRCLEQLAAPASAVWIVDALRRGVPNDAIKPLLNALVALDASVTDHLFELADHRNAAIRARATTMLAGRIAPADSARVRTLASSKRAETRQLAAQLSGTLATPEFTTLLLGLLNDPAPSVAYAAAESLARSNAPNTRKELLDSCARSGADRAFGYLCIALCLREEWRGEMVPQEVEAPCLEAVKLNDPFVSSAAAAVLAGIGYRATDVTATKYLEERVVPVLVRAAAGERFFSDFNSIHTIALRRLSLLSDRDFGNNGPAWGGWWNEQKAQFHANRAGFLLPEKELDAFAVDVETADLKFTIRGDNSDAGAAAVDDEDYLLAAADLTPVVEEVRRIHLLESSLLPGVRGILKLQTVGALEPDEVRANRANTDTELFKVRLRHRGQRKEIGCLRKETWPELAAFVDQCVSIRNANIWQRYRNANAQPDRMAFLATEREFLARETNAEARQGHLMVAILEALPLLTKARREPAYRDLLAIPGISQRLSPDRALQLASMIQNEEPGGSAIRNITKIIAPIAPSKTFDALIQTAAPLPRAEFRADLPIIFAAYPVEQAVRALDDSRALVRANAVTAVGERGSASASAIILDRLNDHDEEVQSAAVRALALRGEKAAVAPIQALARGSSGAVYRECISALGKLNAVECFETIWAATDSPDAATRLAALNAVGNLSDPKAADFLCLYWVRLSGIQGAPANEKAAARNALLSIRADNTRDALRRALDVNDPDVRREVVLALSEFGDPAAVPALLSLFERGVDGPVRNALVTITCVDFFDQADPVQKYREWWDANRSVSPIAWFTLACGRAGLPVEINQNVLESKNALAAIPALSQVMVDAHDWYLRIRAGELLNGIVGQRMASVDRFTPVDERRRFADQILQYYKKQR